MSRDDAARSMTPARELVKIPTRHRNAHSTRALMLASRPYSVQLYMLARRRAVARNAARELTAVPPCTMVYSLSQFFGGELSKEQ